MERIKRTKEKEMKKKKKLYLIVYYLLLFLSTLPRELYL